MQKPGLKIYRSVVQHQMSTPMILLVLFDKFVFLTSTIAGETNYLIGDTLNLNCSLPDLNKWTSQNLFFQTNNPKKAKSPLISLKAFTTPIDNLTAVLTIPNVTMNYTGSYYCCAENDLCEGEYQISDTEVDIQYYPKNVTNVSCTVYNWVEYLTCTWKLPGFLAEDYKYKNQNTYVTVEERTLQTKFEVQCTESFVWPRVKFVVKDQYDISINVSNKEKDVFASQIVRVVRKEVVKPAPVDSLEIKETQNGSLVLTWKHSSLMDKVFKILYRTAELEAKVLVENLTYPTYTVQDVKPYVLYSFSVGCFPSGSKGFWSDFINISITPQVIMPSVGPKVADSCYSMTECQDGFQNVWIYWQRPETNALIDNFIIIEDNKVMVNVTKDNFTSSFQIQCHRRNVRLNIFAKNSKGLSTHPSSVLVLQELNVPLTVKTSFSVGWNKTGDNTVKALWKSDDRTLQFFIYWCKSRAPDTSFICENEIQWMNISDSVTDFVFPLHDNNPDHYKYGISVSRNGSHSEIHWSNCLYYLNPVLGKIPKPHVGTVPLHTSLVVLYSMEKCSYKNLIKITSFLIQFCKETLCNISGNVEEVKKSGQTSQHIIDSLKPDTSYQVRVQGISGITAGQPMVMTVRTLIKGNDVIKTTFIVLAGIVPVCGIVLVLIISVSLCKCLKSRERFRSYTNMSLFPVKANSMTIVGQSGTSTDTSSSNLINH